MTPLAMIETEIYIGRFSKVHGDPVSGWEPHSIIPIQYCKTRQELYEEYAK